VFCGGERASQNWKFDHKSLVWGSQKTLTSFVIANAATIYGSLNPRKTSIRLKKKLSLCVDLKYQKLTF